MSLLIVGISFFMLVHTLPWLPALRLRVINALGEKPYKGIYSLISLSGFVMIVLGMRGVPYVPVYEPAASAHIVTAALMFPALYLLIGRRTGSNVRRLTAHPMMWGISFWAGGHLLANGELASLILFCSFLIYSVLDMLSANSRGARPVSEAAPLTAEIKPLMITIIAYVLLFSLHPWIAGVSLGGG